MTLQTQRRKAEREVQVLEDRVLHLIELRRPVPHPLAQKLRGARLHALQIGPARPISGREETR